MVNLRKLLEAAALGALVLSTVPASADPKENKKEAKEARKEADKDVKDARKDLRDARKDAREAARDGGAEAKKDAREALDEARKKLRDSREQRRKATREAMKAKWGDDLVKKPAVQAELRTHARRMARQHRMKTVANAAGKAEVEKRVDTLIDKENARHDKHMEKLKAAGGEEAK